MDIFRKLRLFKPYTFLIQTIIPFFIPFIFEIPDTIMIFQARAILVIVISAIDLMVIYCISKDEKDEKQILFRNHAARCAYSHLYELNESKRDFYIENAEEKTGKQPYNAIKFIKAISHSFCNVIGEITHIEMENIHTSFIYKMRGASEWKWATQKESTFAMSSEEFLKKEDTVFYQLINRDKEGKANAFIFYNDKVEMAKAGKYHIGTRDSMHNNIGSIMGFKFGFRTNDEVLVEGILIITSYGRRFVKDNNEEDVRELQKLISDDLFPCYQRLLEIEMGLLYSEKCDASSSQSKISPKNDQAKSH